jgi:hypothetical protein
MINPLFKIKNEIDHALGGIGLSRRVNVCK